MCRNGNGKSLIGIPWQWELVTKLGMGRNGNRLHGNGREWECKKPFPGISIRHQAPVLLTSKPWTSRLRTTTPLGSNAVGHMSVCMQLDWQFLPQIYPRRGVPGAPVYYNVSFNSTTKPCFIKRHPFPSFTTQSNGDKFTQFLAVVAERILNQNI